jgi:hypothetical protein
LNRNPSKSPIATLAAWEHPGMSVRRDRVLDTAPYALLAVTLSWVTIHAWGPLKDPDSWWHLRLGEDFLNEHSLETPTHWSSFASSAWVPTQPLPEIFSALVNRWLGLPGVVWLYVATLVVLVIGMYALDRTVSSPLPAAVATLLFVACAENAMTPRPQLVSYALLAVFVVTWLRTEQDLRPRWWLVPLSWLWSMCHGFWFVGVGYGLLALVAILLGHRASRMQMARLASVAVGSCLVVLLNPAGPRVFTAPFAVSERGVYITEWQRTSLSSGPAITALLMVAITSVVWTRCRHDFTVLKLLVVVSAVVWTWYAARTVALAGVVMSPLLASALQTAVAMSPSSSEVRVSVRRERAGLLLGGAVLLTLVAMVVPSTADRPGGVPLALDRRLDRLPAGSTVFNDYRLGGWLAWRHPDLNRWVDGLADAYPVTHLRDTVTITFVEPGWREKLSGSGASAALVGQGSRLAHALKTHGWTLHGTDRGWVLLERP